MMQDSFHASADGCVPVLATYGIAQGAGRARWICRVAERGWAALNGRVELARMNGSARSSDAMGYRLHAA